MNYCVYILYSPSIDKFYIGETEELDRRIAQHNTGFFTNSFTSKTNDWKLFLSIPCHSRSEARKLEAFIKRMKSKKFILKLKDNPAIIDDIKLNKI